MIDAKKQMAKNYWKSFDECKNGKWDTDGIIELVVSPKNEHEIQQIQK